jgi:hypothetical protein
MRGKRAKRLRELARVLCRQEGIKFGEGYNHYNQAMNRIDWEPMIDPDGFPALDGDGEPLMKPGKAPGTITCAWKLRIMYQGLKRQWHDRHRNS